MTARINAWVIQAIARMRSRSFRVVFDTDGENGREVGHVLAALRQFCCAQSPAIGASPEETYRLNGRRDVWLFIQSQLNFTETKIAEQQEAHDDYFGE
ncbi:MULTISPECIES: hypothetical protein [Novosphingobium]|uniref:Bbp19 family protein n=1 Tax=Novosphingobium TaxID=165696 RepID=UPI000D317149|nr:MULTISPECIES: hypothetical protein [Novosphingobium]PTR07873.1 hypothetical protein C8K11_11384 [Novosphingobium sp. GV055]PUB00686.1 hypothetical protein C8K12_11384 [Novosphingobium sp. GV061]PUB16095.1 hypothetical protein C8K14_11384 [Novosphingobium sp. GV079]PUB39560.1 hypothetical protein C8K10_11384 [Novosphingobium sp. GV027]WQD93770.1 hypothetical protein U0041_04005 [Novosphingobium capsulatum]